MSYVCKTVTTYNTCRCDVFLTPFRTHYENAILYLLGRIQLLTCCNFLFISVFLYTPTWPHNIICITNVRTVDYRHNILTHYIIINHVYYSISVILCVSNIIPYIINCISFWKMKLFLPARGKNLLTLMRTISSLIIINHHYH